MRPHFSAIPTDLHQVAAAVSAELRREGIAHALIGGLALERYGYSRATRDVDFLVTEDAANKLGTKLLGGVVHGVTVVRDRVKVDFLFPEDFQPFLEDDVRRVRLVTDFSTGSVSEKVPVVAFPTLIYMKLYAGRRKDEGDVVELLKRSAAVRLVEARKYLRAHAPELVEEFDSLVALAEAEED